MLTLNEFIERDLKDLLKLFNKKQAQYAKDYDSLQDFRTGAKLQFGGDSNNQMFETLKGYMNKHVAFVYNNAVYADKLDESLGDMALYCIIAKYFKYMEDGQDVH